MKGSSQQRTDEVTAMLFEQTLRLFFGDEAALTAGKAHHPASRHYWLKKVCRLTLTRIDGLNATPRLKESLLSTVEYTSEEIHADHQPTWRLVFRLFALTGKLLGYRSHNGALFDLVPEWRNEAQSLTEKMLRGGRRARRDDDNDDNKGARVVRRQIVRLLKRQGVSDGTIAEALRASKYEVQQLRRG